MSDNDYVTNAAWVKHTGRSGTIDDIADQFEHPVPAEVEDPSAAAWPRSSRGWRSIARMHSRPMERRAAG